MMKSHVIPNVCSEYSEHYFRDYQSVIPKSTYPIAWSYYNLLPSHWLAIWRIFRRSPLSEEKYLNRNPAWKQALLIIDFQGNTRIGFSTSFSDLYCVEFLRVASRFDSFPKSLPLRVTQLCYICIQSKFIMYSYGITHKIVGIEKVSCLHNPV